MNDDEEICESCEKPLQPWEDVLCDECVEEKDYQLR